MNLLFAEAALCMRCGELNVDFNERNVLLQHALMHATNGRKLAESHFPILAPVANKFITYLQQRIQIRPDALLRMDFSTTGTSDLPSNSDQEKRAKKACPLSGKVG